MKKLLSLLLVVAMCLGIAGTAFAADATTPSTVAGPAFSDIAGNDAEANITLLAVKGIMKGDAGATTVRPDSTITRAEFAAMVVRMLGKESLATSLASMKPATKDEIPTWAWGYVNLVQNMKIMVGDPDGSFRPNDNVTFAEALAMLERAIGQDKKVIGTWPTNVLLVAYDLGLDDGVDVFANTPATRGEIAIMMVNTMNTRKFLGYADDGDENTADSILAGSTIEGLVAAVDPANNSINIKYDSDGDDEIETMVCDLAAKVSLIGAKTFADLLNINVLAIRNSSSDIVYIEVTDDANVIVGVFDEFTTNDDDEDIIVLEDGKEYVINTDDLEIELNTTTGFDWDYSDIIDSGASVVLNLVDDEVVYIDATQISYPDALVIDEATEGEDKNDPYTLEIDSDGDGSGDALLVDADTPVTIDGAAKKVTDLKEDDVIYVTVVADGDGIDETDDVMAIEAYRATVKGEVTKTKSGASGEFVTLKLADGTTKTYEIDSISDIEPPNVGDNVEYRLNKDGEARLQIGTTSAINPVMVTDLYSQNTGTIHWYAEVDVAGVTRTIEIDEDLYNVLSEDLDAEFAFGFYEDSDADGSDRGVIEWGYDEWERLDDFYVGEIVSVDAVNNIVVIDSDDGYYIVGGDELGFAAYEMQDDGSYEYLPTAELEKGQEVYFEDSYCNLILTNIPD